MPLKKRTGITYLNWTGPNNNTRDRETIDEIDRADFPTARAFRAEVRRLCGEYAMAGMDCYPSQRACAGWNA